MKTLMRNGRDRRSENPLLGHAKKERVSLFGTDQRITSGPAAKRLHSKAGYMAAPERFADSQILLAPRAPSIHGPRQKPRPITAAAAYCSTAAVRSAPSASALGGAARSSWGRTTSSRHFRAPGTNCAFQIALVAQLR